MHRLREILQARRVVSAPPDTSVHAVAVMMSKGRVGAIPIVDGGRLVGVFSERDLMTRVVVCGRDPHALRVADVMTRDVVPRLDLERTHVSEVMTSEVVLASLDESVEQCMEKMRSVGCRHLPVMEDGRLIGMISMRDLLRDEIQEQDDEIRSLKAYIHQTPI
jgi:CBS domain-containing protein